MTDDREMSIEEWCAKLPSFHAVNRDLRTLKHCRSHPIQWAVWDFLRCYLPFRRWRSPMERAGL